MAYTRETVPDVLTVSDESVTPPTAAELEQERKPAPRIARKQNRT